MAMNELFYRVIRTFLKGTGAKEAETHSVQYFNDFGEAKARFFSIVAADYADADITYAQVFIIDKFGRIPEGRIETFDRRDFTPQPEPQPEPEPEPTPEPEAETEGAEDHAEEADPEAEADNA